MKFYTYNDITTLHLELTSKCNAACPQCDRTFMGKTNPLLPITTLSLEDTKQIIDPILQQLSRLYLCGNFGDPIMVNNLHEYINYFRTNPNLQIDLFTNGSARTTDWWEELAFILGNGSVRFAIDGLEDTNHLYRCNTNWNTIINNATTFINNGGIADWDFIAFKHNEHQIEEAEKLSKQLGFRSFRVKKTNRFLGQSLFETTQVYDKQGKPSHIIEPPTKREYKNTWREIENPCIECKVVKDKSVYLSAEGLLFPCCWTAIRMYSVGSKEETDQMRELVERHNIDAKQSSIKDIVESDFFKEIENSWSINSLQTCTRICGQKQFESQFKDTNGLTI